MAAVQNESLTSGDAADPAVTPLDKLTNAQVFGRDVEDYTQESVAETIRRLTKIVQQTRKARQDEAAVKELAAKMKKTNAAAKKKAKPKLAADILDTVL